MPVFAEVANRSELRAVFGNNQKLASEKVAQSSGAVFFNVEIMLQGPEYPKSRLRENVEKFAAEHFFKATNRLAYFDGEEWRHPDGESYSDFFDRAIEYYHDSPALVERFRAEKEGYVRAGLLINNQEEHGNHVPQVAIASPPGEVYRNQSFAPRNVTFIAVPICERSMKLGELPERSYQEYQMIVVPSTEIDTREHWQALVDAGDLQSTLLALNMLESVVRADDPSWVVSLPLLLKNTEALVNKLGYASIDDLIRETEQMLDLDSDDLAPQRRKDMIDYFTNEMWSYVSRRRELTGQDKLRLQGLADVMHDYLSMEGGAQYHGQTFDEVRQLIEGHTKVHQRNLGVNFSAQELMYTNWDYGEYAYQIYFHQLQNNQRAQESRSNGGCPVNMSLPGLEGVETYTSNLGYETNMTELFANAYTNETTTTMECVECPFCHKIVDAIVTSTKIKCPNPECKAEVSRS